MGYDYDRTHNAILESAINNFTGFGFRSASIRRICMDAGVTNGAFYSHFSSKEDLFRKLTDPVVEGLYSLYRDENSNYISVKSRKDVEKALELSYSSNSRMIQYIYENAGTFRLILLSGEGSCYEDLKDQLIRKEAEATKSFLKLIAPYAKGDMISDNIIFQISSFAINTVFGSFAAGNSEDATIAESQKASDFCLAGLREVLKI